MEAAKEESIPAPAGGGKATLTFSNHVIAIRKKKK